MTYVYGTHESWYVDKTYNPFDGIVMSFIRIQNYYGKVLGIVHFEGRPFMLEDQNTNDIWILIQDFVFGMYMTNYIWVLVFYSANLFG